MNDAHFARRVGTCNVSVDRAFVLFKGTPLHRIIGVCNFYRASTGYLKRDFDYSFPPERVLSIE